MAQMLAAEAARAPRRDGPAARTCTCGTHTHGARCRVCASDGDRAPAGPGVGLDPTLAADFGDRFGVDLSTVRVHADADAADDAGRRGAAAYTTGHHITFAAGRFAPHTTRGRALLAHELAHVVQQTGGGGGRGTVDAEVDADRAAGAALAGEVARPAATVAYGTVARKDGDIPLTPPRDTPGALTPANPADTDAGLRVLRDRLDGLRKRYPASAYPVLGGRIATAEAIVLGVTHGGTRPSVEAIEDALDIVAQLDHDLAVVVAKRAQFAAAHAPTAAVDRLLDRYADVVDHLLRPDAQQRYTDAQREAERSPFDVQLDALSAHGQLNAGVLQSAADLVTWTDALRTRLNLLYAHRDKLAGGPADPALTKTVADEATFFDLGMRAVALYTQWLVAWERMLRSRPGIFDIPLIDAMGRQRDRVQALRTAFDAGDAGKLKQLVDVLEADPKIQEFYRALPAAMQVTTLVARVAVTAVVATVTGGVGGLVSGTGRSLAAGITLRAAGRFLGTAVLEAGVFTAGNAAAGAFFFGDRVSLGSLLKDFAWNLGLFGALRAVSGVGAGILRSAELELLRGPVDLTAGFALCQAAGRLRFRWENGRWPTSAETDAMTADGLLLTAGVLAGGTLVGRWAAARQNAALTLVRREYGWAFDALNGQRDALTARIQQAEAAGKGNDPAVLAEVRTKATDLERAYQELLTRMRADRRFTTDQLRKEINGLRSGARDVFADVLRDALSVPAEAGIRRLARGAYSYRNGSTGALEQALRNRYTVTKTTSPINGLRTIEATRPDAPTLTFTERAAGAIDFDPVTFDVQSIAAQFGIADWQAQRMLWRILADNGMATDPRQATKRTRTALEALRKADPRPLDTVLSELHGRGRGAASAPARLTQVADRLANEGILRSAEWLEAREESNQLGVVGEWAAREVAPGPAGSRLLRRVKVKGDVFDDAAGTVPSRDERGTGRVDNVVAESDLVHVTGASGGPLTVTSAASVKAGGGASTAAAARLQNRNLQAVLTATPGALVPLQIGGKTRYARVGSITALDGGQEINVTTALTLAPNATLVTVGPKGSSGFDVVTPLTAKDLEAVTRLLVEKHMIATGVY